MDAQYPLATPTTPCQKLAAADLGRIYEQHAQTVARWVARLGGPGIDVEDTVQEVFLVVHRKLGDFRGDAGFTSWLFRIAWSLVRKRRQRDRLRHWLVGTAEDAGAKVEAPGELPSQKLESDERSRRVARVLESLPDRYRVLLVLFELEGHSGEEVAFLTGIKLSTVWVRLHRARKLFMKRYVELERREDSK